MRLRVLSFLFGAAIVLTMAWIFFALQMPQHVEAGGVVTVCDAAHLDTALAGGGTVTFNCNGNHSPGTIYLNSAEIISTSATIDGANGGNTISIVPVNDTRAFIVNQGIALVLQNLNISDGFDNDGGCIYTNGALSLNNVRLQNCMASTGTRGGAVYVSSTGSATINNSQVVSNTASLSGGGIYSVGPLTLNGSYVAYNKLPDLSHQNSASGDGGGVWAIGTATIDSTTIYSNTAPNGFGGGIYNQGTLNVTNSTVSTNRVQKGGAGIQTYLGTTTLNNVNVISNTVSEYKSTNGGGGLMNSQGTLNLTNVTISDNNGNFAGGGIRNDGTASLSNVTISTNHAEYGGGIRNSANANLTYTGGTVSGNTAYQTGGIYNMNNGFMTLTNLTVTGNQAQAYGGGINTEQATVLTRINITNNTVTGGDGGGIFGVVTLVDSTVSGNTAYNGGGIWGGGYIYKSTVNGNHATNDGGGIYSGGTNNILNSTISGNFADDYGGGIYVASGSTSLFNATVTKNKANTDNSGSGLGGGVSNGGTFYFSNSILAANYSVSPGPILNFDNCYGTLNSQGYNIMDDTSTCTVNGSVTVTSPNLGSLQNNGGDTQTHALLASSPAIDAGNPTGCQDNNNNPLASDQRGFARAVNGRCDIGAYEYDANPPTFTPTPSNTPTITNTPTRTFTPTRTLTPTQTRTPTHTPTRTLTPNATRTPTVMPSATACATKPLKPTLLKPKANASVGKARVKLDWSDSLCATKYKVVVRAESKHGTKAVGVQTTASQYKTQPLASNDYYWRIKACNALGCVGSAWQHFTRP